MLHWYGLLQYQAKCLVGLGVSQFRGVSASMVYLEILWIPTLDNEISKNDISYCSVPDSPGERIPDCIE